MSRTTHLSEPPLPLLAPAPKAADLPYVAGHRDRLRKRFLERGSGALQDYELLELALFLCRPRGDVKPLAYALLDRFGDIAHVAAAPLDSLCKVPGMGQRTAEALKVIEAVGHRMARARIMRRHVISSWDALLDYCRTAMACGTVEEFRVLYLDRKNHLIADECQGEGTVDHVPVYPRKVLKRALDLDASALILVHNHPSGDPAPSEADIAMTRQVEEGGRALGIALHDHLIIGKGAEVSLRAEGHI
jgi:DNA repair protein RadC